MTPMVRTVIRLLAMGIVAWAAGANMARAALVLEGTRIVFPGDAKDVSIRARNTGDKPLLVQSWLDDGRPEASPDTLVVPFLVSPAVTRIEPSSSGMLRLFYTRHPLPSDRESIFYFNVLETPPSSGKDNVVSLKFRTRIKLFFRPPGLPGRAEDAPASLRWSPVGGGVVEVHNPTPYYVSLLSVDVAAKGGRRVRAGSSSMVPPYGKERFSLPAGTLVATDRAAVHFTAINDFGGTQAFESPLPAP